MELPLNRDVLRHVLRRRCHADLRERLEERLIGFVYRPRPETGLAGAFECKPKVRHAAAVRVALDDLARALFQAFLDDAGTVELRDRHLRAILREHAELTAGAFAVPDDPELQPLRDVSEQFRSAARRLGALRESTTGRRPRLPTDAALRELVDQLTAWLPGSPTDPQAALEALRRGILSDFPPARGNRRSTLAGEIRAVLESTRATPSGRATRLLAAWFGTTPQAIRKANKRTRR